jgi:small conductance mechanosensitive channel
VLENIDLEAITSQYIVPWGVNIALALIIFVVGRAVVNMVVNLCKRLMTRTGMDEMLVRFLCSILRWVLLLFVVIAALAELGINTTSLVALLGAAGLAIGLSLQGSLGNFASGVMLIVFRPFTKGDWVEVGGTSGTVDEIGIFTTTLTSGDNKEVIVPNGSIYSSTITNYSARDTRRIDMVFGIGYGDDILKAKTVLNRVLKEDSRILEDPAPTVAVSELADSSVNFVVRPWVNSGDYWVVRFDVIEKVKLAFDAEGISIPFPQMDIHIDNNAED